MCFINTVQYSTNTGLCLYSNFERNSILYHTGTGTGTKLYQYNLKSSCMTVQYCRYSTVKCSYVLVVSCTRTGYKYNTVQYSTVQYSIVQYSTVQYSTVLYSTDNCQEINPKSWLDSNLTSKYWSRYWYCTVPVLYFASTDIGTKFLQYLSK